MKRQWLAEILSGKAPILLQVWAWFEFQRALVGEENGRVLAALAGQPADIGLRYLGKTREEIEQDFTSHLDELNLMAMLGMLASTEGALRIDFIERVRKKGKDRLSRAFWDVFRHRKKQLEKVRLEEHILDNWRRVTADNRIKNAIGEFKGSLHLRHWLAHGRYWNPKLGRAAYDPVSVFEICQELLECLGLIAAQPMIL